MPPQRSTNFKRCAAPRLIKAKTSHYSFYSLSASAPPYSLPDEQFRPAERCSAQRNVAVQDRKTLSTARRRTKLFFIPSMKRFVVPPQAVPIIAARSVGTLFVARCSQPPARKLYSQLSLFSVLWLRPPPLKHLEHLEHLEENPLPSRCFATFRTWPPCPNNLAHLAHLASLPRQPEKLLFVVRDT